MAATGANAAANRVKSAQAVPTAQAASTMLGIRAKADKTPTAMRTEPTNFQERLAALFHNSSCNPPLPYISIFLDTVYERCDICDNFRQFTLPLAFRLGITVSEGSRPQT